MFRRTDRRDEPLDERTLAARNAATQAFLALDDEQGAVAAAVRAATELGTGRNLAEAWETTAAVGYAATEAYLAATRDFPLDGVSPTRAARQADEKALKEIERAREVIRRFRASHSRALDEASFVLTTFPQVQQEAREALVRARSAVQGAPSRRAREKLAEAERSAALIDADGVGLRERRQHAQRTVDLSRAAVTFAAEAPRTAANVRSALSSIATRRAAAATKAGRVEPALSSLRREFSEPCSLDLVDAEKDARSAIAAADSAITAAGRLAGEGDWDAADDEVTNARSALARAEGHSDVVADRLAALREVRADPAKHAADTRFVLRDAQRLVVDRGLIGKYGPILDAQSVRLENAQTRLGEGVHPDYWLFVTELRGVQDRAREVVAQVRKIRP